MTLHVFLLLLLFVLMLSLVRLYTLCWPRHGPAQLAAAKRAPILRLLKPRSPHDCPICRLSYAHSSVVEPLPPTVRPWCEVRSRRGARHPGEHRGFRLSQPAVSVLRNHRRSPPRFGWRWQAWPYRADPDLSLSGLPHHVHRSSPYPFVSPENPLTPDRHGAHGVGRRARPFRCRTGLRLPTSHHQHVADTRWRTCADLA
jgi:hypothetical protein